jgi:peroxiredoxin
LLFLVLVFGKSVEARSQIGQVAPDFECVTEDGKSVRLSEYRGKVVVLDFWASWCGPCREEMPLLVDLHRVNRERGFEILGINIDNEKRNREKFISKLDPRPEFPILLDKEKKVAALYAIETMPTTIFIDREGLIRYWFNGFTKSHGDKYHEALQLLLHKEKRSVTR